MKKYTKLFNAMILAGGIGAMGAGAYEFGSNFSLETSSPAVESCIAAARQGSACHPEAVTETISHLARDNGMMGGGIKMFLGFGVAGIGAIGYGRKSEPKGP